MNNFPTPEAGDEDRDDDREGLDLLASVIDRVADDLPAPQATPKAPLPLAGPTRGPWPPAAAPPSPQNANRRRERRPIFQWVAAATMALLAYPAYLGLVKLPSAQARLAELQATQGDTKDNGNVHVAWISPPRPGTRDSGDASSRPNILLPPGGNVVLLLELPSGLKAGLQGGARWELSGGSRKLLSRRLSAQEVQLQMQNDDALPFLVRAGEVSAGTYTLSLANAAGEELTRVEFDLLPEPR